ncbi:hypothetical protein BROUX41_005365 [Berkeleyomyces rouxiae]|uniref:uncharacterized protein n=1 Tax=Berkeleyomyces rouxiae TaxID=2035830 RepID=UPI003B7BF2F5
MSITSINLTSNDLKRLTERRQWGNVIPYSPHMTSYNDPREGHDEWVLCSQSNVHAVNDIKWLKHTTIRPVHVTVGYGDTGGVRTQAASEGYVAGDVTVQLVSPEGEPVACHLNNAVYVEGLPFNIVSMSRIYAHGGFINNLALVGSETKAVARIVFSNGKFCLPTAGPVVNPHRLIPFGSCVKVEQPYTSCMGLGPF